MERPKKPPVKDPAYLDFIRSQPCYICEMRGEKQWFEKSEAHHTKTKGAGGGDDTAIPLCLMHHRERHDQGRKTFAIKYRWPEEMKNFKNFEDWPVFYAEIVEEMKRRYEDD